MLERGLWCVCKTLKNLKQNKMMIIYLKLDNNVKMIYNCGKYKHSFHTYPNNLQLLWAMFTFDVENLFQHQTQNKENVTLFMVDGTTYFYNV